MSDYGFEDGIYQQRVREASKEESKGGKTGRREE
jgi:hypothetical protein